MNRIDVTYQRACMATPRDKYYTEMYETIVDYNDRNDAPFSNEDIRQATRRVISEEESDARNITSDSKNLTADTLCQTPVRPNTQGNNENVILTIERPNISDALAEIIIGSTINNAEYNELYSAKKKDAKGHPAIDPKVATHTSNRKKREVREISNGYLQHKLLSNRPSQ